MHGYYKFNTPIGPLVTEDDGDHLISIRWGHSFAGTEFIATPVAVLTEKQLNEYFRGLRKEFDLPILPIGTPFQMKCWEELRKIPYGCVITYGELALRIGNAKASRAVGMANNRNPLPIVIPCHRVVGAGKRLVGFGGGLDIKSALLKLEGITDICR